MTQVAIILFKKLGSDDKIEGNIFEIYEKIVRHGIKKIVIFVEIFLI